MKHSRSFAIAMALAAAFAAAGVAAPVHAQGQPSATPIAETPAAQAARFYQEGNRAFEQKRWAEAEAAYLKAWAIAKTYDVASNLGEVELRLDKPRLAAQYLAFSLRTAPPSSKPAQLERTQHFLEQARKRVGAVRVAVSVPDAEVWIDGARIEAEEVRREIFLDPGAHEIVAKRAGYEDAKETIAAAPGASQEVTLRLREVPRPPDGAAGGPTPPGSVSGDAVGSSSQGEGVPRTTVLIAGGATAGAALVAGVILTVVANGKASDAEAQRGAIERAGGPAACATSTPACDELRSSKEAKDALSSAAVWSFVGAGVVGAATGIYALVTREQVQARGIRAMPAMTAGGGGLVLRGTW